MEEFDIATRSCFTFLHYNPTDSLALSSVSFYRNKLNLTADEYIYRNETIVSHQESYLKGPYSNNPVTKLYSVSTCNNHD